MQLLVEVPLSIQSVTEMFTPNCIWRLLRTLAQIRRSYTYTHATLRLYIDSEEVRTGVWGILRSWLALHPKSQCHPWMQIKPWPFQRMFGFFLKLQPSWISTASGISIRSPLKDRRFFIILISMKKMCPVHFFQHYFSGPCGDGSKPWYLVNPKIAGKWMFIPLKMYL